jgi:hypothetical protein
MSTAFDVSFAAVRPASASVSSPPDVSHGDAFVKLENVALTYGRDERRVHAWMPPISVSRGRLVALVSLPGAANPLSSSW